MKLCHLVQNLCILKSSFLTTNFSPPPLPTHTESPYSISRSLRPSCPPRDAFGDAHSSPLRDPETPNSLGLYQLGLGPHSAHPSPPYPGSHTGRSGVNGSLENQEDQGKRSRSGRPMKLKALPSMLNSDWLTIPEQALIQGRQWQDGVPGSGEGTGVGRLRCWEIFISPSSMPKSSTGKSIMDCGLLSGCQSIIFVHDLTNKKSSQNLRRWSLEALNRDLVPTGVLVTNGDYDREQFADNQIPLLVIGTKLDQIHETKRHEVLTRTAFLAEDFNPEEINLPRPSFNCKSCKGTQLVRLQHTQSPKSSNITCFWSLSVYSFKNTAQITLGEVRRMKGRKNEEED
ncbi:hypothetical protein H8959_020439 [Pygathrix nigripes]